jgi:hypothetical protein
MLEWIAGHWFQLLVLASLSIISLCLWSIGTALINAINGRSAEIVSKLWELGNSVMIVERRLESIEQTLSGWSEHDKTQFKLKRLRSE